MSPVGDRVLFATFPGLAAQSLRGGGLEKLFAATVDGGGEVFHIASPPQVLFSTKMGVDFERRQFQASDDGERFLVNTQIEDAVPRLLTVVLNWKPPVKKN